jgi:hypothetical protein
VVVIYASCGRWQDINSNPYQMKMSQIFWLSVLTVVSVVFDYIAIVSYS